MKIAIASGTRPEKIKLEPVAHALAERAATVLWYETVQSPDLVTGTRAQGVSWGSLHEGVASVVRSFQQWAQTMRPDAVLVQGDTATAFAVALSAFLLKLPIGHVEAGLRTYEAEPWPEEAFRRMIAPLATWHFAADADSRENLVGEGIPASAVFITGNPVIDSLAPQRPEILVTLHRRENWGERITEALSTLNDIAVHEAAPIITVVKHPNLRAWLLKGSLELLYPNLHFIDPQPAERFRAMLRMAAIVVTDSGGLQEEAAYYGKPCLVLRTSTERRALQDLGAVTLVHPDEPDALRSQLQALLRRRTAYGTGNAGSTIASILLKELEQHA